MSKRSTKRLSKPTHKRQLVFQQYIRPNQNICSDQSLYYSNRAVSYKVLGMLNEVVSDCERALQLCQTNTRALSIYGVLLVNQAKLTSPDMLDEQTLQLTAQGIHHLEHCYALLEEGLEKSKEKLRIMNRINLLRAKRILFLQVKTLDEKSIINQNYLDCQNLIQML